MTWMEWVLLLAGRTLYGLTFLLTLLVAGIIVHRVFSNYQDRRVARRRVRYEESVVLLVTGDLEPLPFLRGVAAGDRHLVEELLLEYAAKVTPAVRSSLAPVFVGLGAPQRNRRHLGARLWWKRAEAARRLGLMYDRENLRPLSRLLRDPELEVRVCAARSLVELGVEHWHGTLIQTLDAPDTMSTLRFADVILEAGQTAVPGLIRFAQTCPNPKGVSVALEILGDMRAVEAEPVMLEALLSASKEVRAAACRALGRVESPGALQSLCRALEDPAWEVRNQAVRALGAIGDPVAVPYLLPLLQLPEPWTVFRTASALVHMEPGGREAVTAELARLQADPGHTGLLTAQLLQEVLQQTGIRSLGG